MKKSVLTLLLLLTFFQIIHSASKQVVIDSVKINLDRLLLDFCVEGIIDQKAVEGLQNGLTSTIEYQIQLWEQRSGWVNNLITSRDVRMKVFFDNWENKYKIISSEEERTTSSLETVREKCSQFKNIEVVLLDKLKKKKKYFITVKAILRPLSVENYQEIKNWISGQAKNLELKQLDDTEQQEKKVTGGMFKIFLALTGFGDRVVSGKSSNFSIIDQKVLMDE